MTITKISDREIALQAQLTAMTASRDEYQQAADKMAWDHKVERDTLRQHIKHIGNDALRSENHELRQQLAEAQAEVSRLEPLQFRQAPCHKFCESTAFEIEIRSLKKQLAEALRDAERYRFRRSLYVASHGVTPEELDAATDETIAAMKGTA
jgi:regulator of replication initiation timing